MYVRGGAGGGGRRPAGMRSDGAQQSPPVDRLGDVAVHADERAAFDVLPRGIGGHGEDRDTPFKSDQLSGLVERVLGDRQPLH